MACNQPTQTESLPYYNEETFTPLWLAAEDIDDFHKIPEFSFTDQSGNTFGSKDLEGKIYVADFFFATCPGICPRMTKNMKTVQDSFIDNPMVTMVSFSVTPSIDSVPALRQFAIRNGVTPHKWHLLTGNRDEIYRLGREAYFIEQDLGKEKSADDFLHTENFVLIDRQGHIRGIYNGLNKTDVKNLTVDIKSLL